MAHEESKRIELSVFKGRKAKLNRAIFQILLQLDPLTIYDIYKEVKTKKDLGHTRYANVNMRVKALQQTGYIRKIREKKTKAGFHAALYTLTAKALFALVINSIDPEKLLRQISEEKAQSLIGDLINAM